MGFTETVTIFRKSARRRRKSHRSQANANGKPFQDRDDKVDPGEESAQAALGLCCNSARMMLASSGRPVGLLLVLRVGCGFTAKSQPQIVDVGGRPGNTVFDTDFPEQLIRLYFVGLGGQLLVPHQLIQRVMHQGGTHVLLSVNHRP